MATWKQVIDAFKMKAFKHQLPKLQFTSLCFYYSGSSKSCYAYADDYNYHKSKTKFFSRQKHTFQWLAVLFASLTSSIL